MKLVSFWLLCTILLLPMSFASESPPPDLENIKKKLTKQYRKPVVENLRAFVGSLYFVDAYEMKNAAEDPLTADRWIVDTSHRVYPAKDYAKALKKIEFHPQTPEQALAVAQEILSIEFHHSTLVNHPDDLAEKEFGKVRMTVQAPRVESVNDGYRANFFILLRTLPSGFGMDGDQPRSLLKVTISVGKKHFGVERSEVIP